MRLSRQNSFLGFKEEENPFKDKKLLIVGCGGVGSILSDLLVRGGFKNLVLVDFDVVDNTNLQRQLYFQQDIGKLKVKALKEYLLKIDTDISVEILAEKINATNIEKVSKNCNLIVDCTDNIEIRKVINSFCVKENKDWLHLGAIKGSFTSVLFQGNNSKFNSIFREGMNDESCCDVGVLSSTTHGCASLGFNEILKYFILENKNYDFTKINLWNYQLFKFKLI